MGFNGSLNMIDHDALRRRFPEMANENPVILDPLGRPAAWGNTPTIGAPDLSGVISAINRQAAASEKIAEILEQILISADMFFQETANNRL